MILTDVSDTIHADSLALFALNIEILLADVTKPGAQIDPVVGAPLTPNKQTNKRKVENSDFDLTCDVISDVWVKFLTLYG